MNLTREEIKAIAEEVIKLQKANEGAVFNKNKVENGIYKAIMSYVKDELGNHIYSEEDRDEIIGKINKYLLMSGRGKKLLSEIAETIYMFMDNV